MTDKKGKRKGRRKEGRKEGERGREGKREGGMRDRWRAGKKYLAHRKFL